MTDRWSELRVRVGHLASCNEDLVGHARQRAALLAARDAVMKAALQADRAAQAPQIELSRAAQLGARLRRRLRQRRRLRKIQFEARVRGVSGLTVNTGPTAIQRLRQKLHSRQATRRARCSVASQDDVLNLSTARGERHDALRLLLQRQDSIMSQADRGEEQRFPGWAAESLPIFAVNNLHARPGNSTYGDYQEVIEDTQRLGASVVRQPGLDLYLDDIFGKTKHPDGDFNAPSLPVVSEMWAKLVDFEEKFTKMLVALDRSGQSAIFTLISLGGGGEHTVKIADGDYDAIVKAIPVVWTDAHKAEEIDGIKWDSGDELGALDLRSEYQRAWLVRFVGQICTLLKNIERKYFSEIGIESVIAGLEIVNEADIRNINVTKSRENEDEKYGVVAARYTGRNWGTLVYAIAKAIYQQFGERVPAMLPGLASHDVSESKLSSAMAGAPRKSPNYVNTWSWKRFFFEFLVEKFKELFKADTGWADRPVGGPSKLVRSVDLHFYHKQKAADITIGPLHIARVRWQVELMRHALDDTTGGLMAMSETLITNIESGVSAWDPDDFMPVVFSSEAEPPIWQSWEVWRRLVGGLAAGAYVAGWNSWRSNPGTDKFQGSGLREDASDSTESSTPVPPDEALQRASWFAFQRCASIIKVVSQVEMLLPGASTDVDKSADATDDVVVLEIGGLLEGGKTGGSYYFGYLLFVDGWRNTTDRFRLHATPDWGRGLTARQIAILPSEFGETAGRAGQLPYNDSFFFLSSLAESAEVAIPASGKAMYIELAAGPRLLLTRAPLTWTVTSA